jgi:phosphonoacetaldehyde hydrolase
MSWSYGRAYRGPIEAVLLDWAGTTVDFGCLALSLAEWPVLPAREQARTP